MKLRVFAAFCATALLPACAGRIDGPPHAGSFVPAARNTAQAAARLVIRVRVPQPRLRPDFVSPATRGMTVKITGPTAITQTVGLTLRANGCHGSLMTLQCTLVILGLEPCSSKGPCYTASVATYDKFDPAHNRIPRDARELSADQNFRFRIGKGATIVPLTLQGIPKKIAFIPSANSSLSGNQNSGFVLPKCTTTAQDVTMAAIDADGNYIVGIGAPKLSLSTSDSAQLSVKKPKSPTNSIFALGLPKSPKYPFGNYTVQLTAKAIPSGKSGASAVTSTIHVTYSGDVCGRFSEFVIPTANSSPYGIADGPDGKLWFTESSGNKVGRISTSGSIKEFPVPTGSSGPAGIVTGPDGKLWFTESTASKIASITTAGTILEFPTVTANSFPFTIAKGSDDNLWFTEQRGNIAKITPTGAVTEYALPYYSNPYGITSGPDGALWATELTGNTIDRVTTTGTITRYAIPTARSFPSDIATGGDGALWFAEEQANKIGRIGASGTVTSEFPTPNARPGRPTFVTLGPDGNVWFSETRIARIARISTGGTTREFKIPTSGAQPYHLTTGPDGAIWFVEYAKNRIGRLW